MRRAVLLRVERDGRAQCCFDVGVNLSREWDDCSTTTGVNRLALKQRNRRVPRTQSCMSVIVFTYLAVAVCTTSSLRAFARSRDKA